MSQSAFKHSTVRASQAGLTLIELMVAMLIGLFLILGSVTVFTQSRGSYRVSDNIARVQENARFALDTMEPDIRLAGFWGRTNLAAMIPAPVGIAVTCGGNNVTNWALLNLGQDIEVIDDNYAALPVPCPPFTGARGNSDVLVLRHASAQVMPPTPGMIQLHADLGTAQFFSNGITPIGVGPAPQTHDMVVNLYYVDNGSNLDPTLPSLRVKTLVNGGVLQDQELITGVENLQVQLGIDTNSDGQVDRYVDADHPIAPGNPGFGPNAQVISMRLWMLMRTELAETGYTDVGPYVTPDVDVPPIVPGGAQFPNTVRRIQVSKTVFLRNS